MESVRVVACGAEYALGTGKGVVVAQRDSPDSVVTGEICDDSRWRTATYSGGNYAREERDQHSGINPL